MRERAREAWLKATGQRGWRSIAGPVSFAVFALGLLLFDHLQQKVPHIVFWLGLALIGSVFAWMIQASRRQQGALVEHTRNELSDRVTGLNNRLRLETDIEAAVRVPGDRRVLLVFDL